MELIRFEKVALGYEGQTVVKGLNFEVNKGDYLCILGQNGSGKSTVMKAILGLVSPVEGRILRAKELKNSIGYLPQQQLTQADFPASVREVVLSGCLGRKKAFCFFTGKDKALAEEKMRKMEILDLADRCYRELSGGQKQRVLLARSMCAAKEMMLLDEPVTGLDPTVTEEFYATVKQLHREGLTVVMISHDPEKALSSATHVLHLGQSMLYFGKTDGYDRGQILLKEEH